jgi:hypothetical protein
MWGGQGDVQDNACYDQQQEHASTNTGTNDHTSAHTALLTVIVIVFAV